jgi:hypothetical protein
MRCISLIARASGIPNIVAKLDNINAGMGSGSSQFFYVFYKWLNFVAGLGMIWIYFFRVMCLRSFHVSRPSFVVQPAMQLSILRLAPLLGLHALLCLFHLQSRPMLAGLTSQFLGRSAQPGQTQNFEQVQFPTFWQPFKPRR